MKTRTWSALVCVFALIVVGCGSSKELTRSHAKEIIESSQAFNAIDDFKDQIRLNAGWCQEAQQKGYWTAAPNNNLVVSPTGSAFFRKAFVGSEGECSIVPSNQWKRRVVEVTGISSSPVFTNAQQVDYTWKWECPSGIKDFCGPLPTKADGAILQLFDDGWRRSM